MTKNVQCEVFVSKKVFEFVGGNFNHCSTICPYNDGIIIAWYCGTNECSDDQSVLMLYSSKNDVSKPLRLNFKTGNPVLWNNNNQIYLLCSYFVDNNNIKILSDKWKYCKLLLHKISINNNDLYLVNDPIIIDGDHLLGRCKPVLWREKIYIPLYDEVNRTGVIVSGIDLNFELCGRIGQNMIQPTLWVNNNKLHSLSRTFHSIYHYSQYSNSDDGQIWSEPYLTDIPNRNNSLHALNWNGYQLLIWNDTQSIQRTNLTTRVNY